MSHRSLVEASSALTRGQGENVWEAVLITAGKGSSGVYSESLLRNYGKEAFPAGTHSYVDHPKSEGDTRSPKNLMGVLTEDAHYEEGRGLVGKIQVMPHWKSFVEAVAPYTGLSIYATGDGKDVNGEYIVESLLPDRMNSVDLVSYAGRGGALVDRLYESATRTSVEDGTKPDATLGTGEQKEAMDKEILEALKDLKTTFDTFVTESKTAATANVQAEANADALKTAAESAVAEYDKKVAAIDAADGLLPSQVTELRAAAKRGEDVAPLIESAKKIVEDVSKHLSEGASIANGRFVEGAGSGSFGISEWSVR